MLADYMRNLVAFIDSTANVGEKITGIETWSMAVDSSLVFGLTVKLSDGCGMTEVDIGDGSPVKYLGKAVGAMTWHYVECIPPVMVEGVIFVRRVN